MHTYTYAPLPFKRTRIPILSNLRLQSASAVQNFHQSTGDPPLVRRKNPIDNCKVWEELSGHGEPKIDSQALLKTSNTKATLQRQWGQVDTSCAFVHPRRVGYPVFGKSFGKKDRSMKPEGEWGPELSHPEQVLDVDIPERMEG